MKLERLQCDAEGCPNAEEVNIDDQRVKWVELQIPTGEVHRSKRNRFPYADKSEFDLCPSCAVKVMQTLGLRHKKKEEDEVPVENPAGVRGGERLCTAIARPTDEHTYLCALPEGHAGEWHISFGGSRWHLNGEFVPPFGKSES